MSNSNEKQSTALQLSKSSTKEQVKAYFTQVLNLKNSGEDFPVNLEDVFPLVYHDKKKAVEELRKRDEFGNDRYIQGIDYQTSPQKVQAGKHNKTVKNVYKLSVECMEWFIARKIRPVFEVYRQLAHAYIEGSTNMFGQKFITMAEYCERYNKSKHSFNALYGHYPMEFIYMRGVWSISTDLCQKVEFENRTSKLKSKLKERNDPNQLSIDFNDSANE